MINKPNMSLLIIALSLTLLIFACEDSAPVKTQSPSNVISKKISQPANQVKSAKSIKNSKDNKSIQKNQTIKKAKDLPSLALNKTIPEEDHYNSKGKIDPFKPLIQEKTEETTPAEDNRPKRILTPLEKIELSQIRLVAVIIMKDRQIAMVEEANGKGYEVGIGTYIGRNQGRVAEIKNSSIVVKELVKDFKGRLKEKIQEIKLHKNDSEE